MDTSFQYDLFVIGGGSGGLSTSKAAAKLNQKVAIADYVNPSPQGSIWGLGGTCVNVGCIPKKLFHFASQIGELRRDQIEAGWSGIEQEGKHDWLKMTQFVTAYIQRLNKMHGTYLDDNKVTYYNKLARFVDKNTIELTDHEGKTEKVTAKVIFIAVGSRPTIPDDIPDLKSKVITSDDIFLLKKSPGKTLVVGASYVALESAGFLHGLGLDTTVMVRSFLLRGFDQEMAERVGNFMKDSGIKFIRPSTPKDIKLLENGQKLVSWEINGEKFEETFDTVLYAIGRTAVTKYLNLEQIGIKTVENQKVLCNDQDQTSVDNVYAIGDCVEGRLELTPTAIMCGRRLVRRLYAGGTDIMDYADVATTIFTPLEYGSVGMAEEQAKKEFGRENVRVFYSGFKPTTWTYNATRNPKACYGKLVVHIPTDRVVGLHYCGPDAAEVVQGFGVAIKMRATKKDFDNTVGIHPSGAEELVQMTQTKSE